MWPSLAQHGIPALLQCLPSSIELYEYLEAFHKRSQNCSFPYNPDQVTRTEVERFLSDPGNNATLAPDMLALLFAALAQATQIGAHDKCNGQWNAQFLKAEASKGDVWRK
jgi:hypothetical protein